MLLFILFMAKTACQEFGSLRIWIQHRSDGPSFPICPRLGFKFPSYVYLNVASSQRCVCGIFFIVATSLLRLVFSCVVAAFDIDQGVGGHWSGLAF